MIQKTVWMLLFLPCIVFAHSGRSQGIKLEKELWAGTQAKDIKGAKETLTNGFQLLSNAGLFDKAQTLHLIKDHLTILSYSLSDFVVTKSKDILIVTYTAQVRELYQGHIIGGSAPRITLWHEDDETLAAHATSSQAPV